MHLVRKTGRRRSPSFLTSHARTKTPARFTVLREVPSAAAACSTDSPAKNRSRTTAAETESVFGSMPERRTFLGDLGAAGIQSEDGNRHFDLQAIRASLATFLARRVVGQRLAHAHMRHTDQRLTAVTYIDAEVLRVPDAISVLPALAARDGSSLHDGEAANEAVEGPDPSKGASHRPRSHRRNGQNGTQPVTASDSNVAGGPCRERRCS